MILINQLDTIARLLYLLDFIQLTTPQLQVLVRFYYFILMVILGNTIQFTIQFSLVVVGDRRTVMTF